MKEKKKKKENSALHDFLIYATIIIVVILIRTFLITPVKVTGTSMDDTLSDGEIMILNKITYKKNNIKRFDIVVVKEGNSRIIKRVIGLPKESLEYKNNILYINNKETKEPYTRKETNDFNITSLGYKTIPDKCYIVMGDNRTVSYDSRELGCIREKDILGKANLVIFPFTKIGYKK